MTKKRLIAYCACDLVRAVLHLLNFGHHSAEVGHTGSLVLLYM